MRPRIPFSVLAPVCLAVLAVAALPACRSQLTGNEGNFEFSYVADDRVADFNKPIAIGARLDLEVRDVGAQQPVTLSAASTDDETVLGVVAFEGLSVTVEGKAEGGALLEVTGTTAGGEELSDSVNLLVRAPEVLKLHHTCAPESTSAAYLTDARVFVAYDMERENGQPVIGYGLYPATASDAAAFAKNTDASGQVYMAFDTGAAAATLTLDSDIDDTSLDVAVVAPGDIDDIAEPIAFVLEDIDVGDKNAFYVLPRAGERTICQAETEKTVTSDTPETCAVRERDAAADGGDEKLEFGWFEIEGVAAGECRYTVSYPSGNGGAGVSKQFSYEIQP